MRLAELLESGWRLLEEVEASTEPSSEAAVVRKVQRGIRLLEHALSAVDELQLFRWGGGVERVPLGMCRALPAGLFFSAPPPAQAPRLVAGRSAGTGPCDRCSHQPPPPVRGRRGRPPAPPIPLGLLWWLPSFLPSSNCSLVEAVSAAGT